MTIPKRESLRPRTEGSPRPARSVSGSTVQTIKLVSNVHSARDLPRPGPPIAPHLLWEALHQGVPLVVEGSFVVLRTDGRGRYLRGMCSASMEDFERSGTEQSQALRQMAADLVGPSFGAILMIIAPHSEAVSAHFDSLIEALAEARPLWLNAYAFRGGLGTPLALTDLMRPDAHETLEDMLRLVGAQPQPRRAEPASAALSSPVDPLGQVPADAETVEWPTALAQQVSQQQVDLRAKLRGMPTPDAADWTRAAWREALTARDLGGCGRDVVRGTGNHEPEGKTSPQDVLVLAFLTVHSTRDVILDCLSAVQQSARYVPGEDFSRALSDPQACCPHAALMPSREYRYLAWLATHAARAECMSAAAAAHAMLGMLDWLRADGQRARESFQCALILDENHSLARLGLSLVSRPILPAWARAKRP